MTGEPVIKALPEVDLVGLTVSTYPLSHPKNDPQVIPQLWGFLMQHLDRLQVQPTGPMYGASVMEDGGLTYLAGFESADIFLGAEKWLVPGGEYAVFEHIGSVSTLAATFDFIWKDWLPRSGRTPAETPLLEIYDGRYVPESPTSVFEIAVPLISAQNG